VDYWPTGTFDLGGSGRVFPWQPQTVGFETISARRQGPEKCRRSCHRQRSEGVAGTAWTKMSPLTTGLAPEDDKWGRRKTKDEGPFKKPKTPLRTPRSLAIKSQGRSWNHEKGGLESRKTARQNFYGSAVKKHPGQEARRGGGKSYRGGGGGERKKEVQESEKKKKRNTGIQWERFGKSHPSANQGGKRWSLSVPGEGGQLERNQARSEGYQAGKRRGKTR